MQAPSAAHSAFLIRATPAHGVSSVCTHIKRVNYHCSVHIVTKFVKGLIWWTKLETANRLLIDNAGP